MSCYTRLFFLFVFFLGGGGGFRDTSDGWDGLVVDQFFVGIVIVSATSLPKVEPIVWHQIIK